MEQLVFAIACAGGIPLIGVIGGWISYKLRWCPLFRSLEKHLATRKVEKAGSEA